MNMLAPGASEVNVISAILLKTVLLTRARNTQGNFLKKGGFLVFLIGKFRSL
jgi:hypothetical protein